jgi:predicted O-methyltransferase YrrM
VNERVAGVPPVVERLQIESHELGFVMASEPMTGLLLRTLAASKPGGFLLELGTGTGVGAAWLLSGMDAHSRLVSIDNDSKVAEVAHRHLSGDQRVTFRIEDAATWLAAQPSASIDLVFADTWAGKYTHLDDALRLLKPGGLYIVDDMLPQQSWSSDHALSAERLVADLECRAALAVTKLNWSTGIVIAVMR